MAWVCDLDPQRLNEAASVYPQIKLTENINNILLDHTVKGVIIATAPESHYMLSKKFISRGKSVLVEKPVTIDLKDSIDLINLAAAQNTVLMAGYILIYHPLIKKIKKVLEETNNIGELCYLNMSRTNTVSQFSGADVLHDLAVHDIYLSRYLIGENPIWVTAYGGSYAKRCDRNTIYILLGFPHGITVSIYASAIHSEKIRKVSVVTSKSKLVFDDSQTDDKKVQLFINGESKQALSIEDNLEPLRSECLHFLECIRENLKPQSGSDEILGVARITDCISNSLAMGGEKVAIR